MRYEILKNITLFKGTVCEKKVKAGRILQISDGGEFAKIHGNKVKAILNWNKYNAEKLLKSFDKELINNKTKST